MLSLYTIIYFFQLFLSDSRIMTSHYVICHVTAVTYLFIVQKRKEKKYKTSQKKKTQKKIYKIQKNKIKNHEKSQDPNCLITVEVLSYFSHLFFIYYLQTLYTFLIVYRYIQQQISTCIFILYQLIIFLLFSQVFILVAT